MATTKASKTAAKSKPATKPATKPAKPAAPAAPAPVYSIETLLKVLGLDKAPTDPTEAADLARTAQIFTKHHVSATMAKGALMFWGACKEELTADEHAKAAVKVMFPIPCDRAQWLAAAKMFKEWRGKWGYERLIARYKEAHGDIPRGGQGSGSGAKRGTSALVVYTNFLQRIDAWKESIEKHKAILSEALRRRIEGVLNDTLLELRAEIQEQVDVEKAANEKKAAAK